MTEFRIDHIPATPMNGADIPAMVNEEQRRAYEHSPVRSQSKFTVLTPSEQVDALTEHPEKYWGAFDDNDRILAYMKLSDWHRADQIAYESFGAMVKYKLGRVLHTSNSAPELPGLPKGIFGLTAHSGLARNDAVSAIGQLVEQAIEEAGDSEIRIGHYAGGYVDDPARTATSQHGFITTTHFGYVGGMLQELHVHKPQ